MVLCKESVGYELGAGQPGGSSLVTWHHLDVMPAVHFCYCLKLIGATPISLVCHSLHSKQVHKHRALICKPFAESALPADAWEAHQRLCGAASAAADGGS